MCNIFYSWYYILCENMLFYILYYIISKFIFAIEFNRSKLMHVKNKIQTLTSIFVSVLMSTSHGTSEDGIRDTREGEDVTLECRFPPQTSIETLTYYWAKKNKHTHDNVAIGNVPLDANYRWVFSFHVFWYWACVCDSDKIIQSIRFLYFGFIVIYLSRRF